MIYSTHTGRPQALGLPGWQKTTINKWEAANRYARKRQLLERLEIYTNQALRLLIRQETTHVRATAERRWFAFEWTNFSTVLAAGERLEDRGFQRPLEAAIYAESYREGVADK